MPKYASGALLGCASIQSHQTAREQRQLPSVLV